MKTVYMTMEDMSRGRCNTLLGKMRKGKKKCVKIDLTFRGKKVAEIKFCKK